MAWSDAARAAAAAARKTKSRYAYNTDRPRGGASPSGRLKWSPPGRTREQMNALVRSIAGRSLFARGRKR